MFCAFRTQLVRLVLNIYHRNLDYIILSMNIGLTSVNNVTFKAIFQKAMLIFMLLIIDTDCFIQTRAVQVTSPNTLRSISASSQTGSVILNTAGSATNSTTTTIFNFILNNNVVIQNMRSWTFTTFREFRGHNTPLSNTYLYNSNTRVSTYDSNFTVVTYSLTYTNTTVIRTCYGSSPLSFYQMTQTTVNFSVLYCSRSALGSNFTCTTLFSFINETNLEMKYQSNYLVIVSYMLSTPASGIVRVYNANGSVHALNQNWNISLLSTSLFIETNSMYLAIAVSMNVSIYKISQNFNFICYTLINGTTLYSLKLTNYSFIASYDAEVGQYSLFNCAKWTAVVTPGGNRIDIINTAGNMLMWKQSVANFSIYMYNQSYPCLNSLGCVCQIYFCPDSTYRECFFGGYGVPCLYTAPNNPLINASNTTNSTNTNNLTNRSNTVNNNPPLVPTITINNSMTSQNCPSYCEKCLYNPYATCISCKNFFVLEDNKCVLPLHNKILVSFTATFNIFRIHNGQRFYFLTPNLQLYNYHITEYEGIFRYVLDFINFLQNQFWSIFATEFSADWLNEPFPLPDYTNLTDIKFLQTELKDAVLIQNLKPFLIVYVPFVVLTFWVLNRLFYLFFNYRISAILRLYSMWLYLAVVIFNQNIDILSFLSLKNFQILSCFNTQMYLIRAVQIIICGSALLGAFCGFLLSPYFYGRLSKYFMSNMYGKDFALMLTVCRFVMKPIIQSAIHCLCYEHPKRQIFLLLSSNIISLLVLLYFQSRYSIFIVKSAFFCDCILQFNMLLLNTLIYCRYYLYAELADMWEDGFTVSMYIFVGVQIFYFLVSLIYLFKSKSHKIAKKRSKYIWDGSVPVTNISTLITQSNLLAQQSKSSRVQHKIRNCNNQRGSKSEKKINPMRGKVKIQIKCKQDKTFNDKNLQSLTVKEITPSGLTSIMSKF